MCKVKHQKSIIRNLKNEKKQVLKKRYKLDYVHNYKLWQVKLLTFSKRNFNYKSLLWINFISENLSYLDKYTIGSY